MQQEQEPKKTPNDSEGGDPEGDAIPPIAITAIAVWVFLVGLGLLWWIISDYIPDRTESVKLFIASIFSLALAIVVVIQTAIYFKQAKLLDAQLKISDDTFKLLERPAVGVINVELLPIKDSENRIVRFSIQNTGHLPARSVTTICGAQITKSGTAETCGDLWSILPLPVPGIISKGVIPVNSIFTSYSLPPMTKAQFELLKDENKWLYAYCRIEYGSDGKTQPYFTEYYGRWSRDTQLFDVCDKHNDAN